MKIHTGDNVVIIAGKDRGKTGVVSRVFTKTAKVLVDGCNVVTRHEKAKRRGSQGQIVSKPMPIDISNVAIKDAKTGKPARVGYVVTTDGDSKKKKRVLRPSGAEIG